MFGRGLRLKENRAFLSFHITDKSTISGKYLPSLPASKPLTVPRVYSSGWNVVCGRPYVTTRT